MEGEMTGGPEWKNSWARVALASIRLFNGVAALVAPEWLVRRLGVDPESQGVASYVFRMFGIRTVLMGLELLSSSPERRAQSLRAGPLVHATDTLAALLAGVQGRLPRRGAATVFIISTINTILAIVALSRERER
jgi:hypothetical protein